MTTQVQELYVFRVRQPVSEEKSLSYWRFARDSHRSDYSPSFVSKAEEATHLRADDYQGIVAMYQKLVRGRNTEDVEFVKVTVTTSLEQVDMGADEILEERRRVALTKLSHDDVLALGVENLAVYSKLKYHVTPKRDSNDIDF